MTIFNLILTQCHVETSSQNIISVFLKCNMNSGMDIPGSVYAVDLPFMHHHPLAKLNPSSLLPSPWGLPGQSSYSSARRPPLKLPIGPGRYQIAMKCRYPELRLIAVSKTEKRWQALCSQTQCDVILFWHNFIKLCPLSSSLFHFMCSFLRNSF